MVNWPMPTGTPIRDAIIADARNTTIRRAKRNAALALVPGGHNACGANLSQYVCGKGRLLPSYKPAYNLAQNLINAIEQTGKTQRLPPSSATEAGVIIVAMDLNGNHLTDHVGLSVGIGIKTATFLMVDNQKADPYDRNIGSGAKTPVLYVLRILA